MTFKIVTNFPCNIDSYHEEVTNDRWLDAFEDADIIFALATKDGFQKAREAKAMLSSKQIFVLEIFHVGPALQLLASKLDELVKDGKAFKEIRNTMMDFRGNVRSFFMLPPLLGSRKRRIGTVNFEGDLTVTDLCYGENKSFTSLIDQIKYSGYHGGKILLSSKNKNLKQLLLDTFGDIQIEYISSNKQGLFIGLEL